MLVLVFFSDCYIALYISLIYDGLWPFGQPVRAKKYEKKKKETTQKMVLLSKLGPVHNSRKGARWTGEVCGQLERWVLLVACYATLHPAMSVCWLVCRLVGRLVNWSVPFLLFWRFWAFWAYSSCLYALVTSSTAPAHLQATRVAVYPALLNSKMDCWMDRWTDG